MANISTHHDNHHCGRTPPKASTVLGFSVAGGLVLGACVMLITTSVLRRDEAPALSANASAPAVSVASAAITPTTTGGTATDSQSPTDLCERQTWPYVTYECQQGKTANAGSSRKVRVITGDPNAPTFIASPTPIVAQTTTKIEPAKTQVPAQHANTAAAVTTAAAAGAGGPAPAMPSHHQNPTPPTPPYSPASPAAE
jgi:hypothetical protein